MGKNHDIQIKEAIIACVASGIEDQMDFQKLYTLFQLYPIMLSYNTPND